MIARYLYFAFILIICCTSNTTNAQNHFSLVGSKTAARSGTSVAYQDFWSLQNNQAGMASVKDFSAGIFYENRYLEKAFSMKGGGIILPSSVGNFGLSVNYFGIAQFNEQKIGLAYARAFGDRVRAGIQFDYLRTFAGLEYGSANKFTFEMGIQTDLSDQLSFGAHVFNPIQVKIDDYSGERIPTTYRAGFLYQANDELDFGLDFLQETNRPLRVMFGTSFEAHENFNIQAGIATQPWLASFGASFNYGSFEFGLATSYHEILGFSPNASCIYKRR